MPSPFTCSIQISCQTPKGVQTHLWGLNILSIADTWDASLVRHAFINVDGAIVDNLGFHARQIRFTSYWFGNQATFPSIYESPTYENHLEFMNSVTNSTGAIAFSHPKYGTVRARIESVNVRHDDTQNYAEIEISLVEDAVKTNSRVIMEQDIELVSQKLQADAINGQMDKMKDDLQSLKIIEVMNKIINTTEKISAQITKASNTARKWMKAADNFVAVCDQFAVAVEQPLNVISGSLQYASDVPSRVIGSVQRVTDRIAATAAASATAPTAIVSAFSSSLTSIIDSVTGDNADMFKQYLRVIGAAVAGTLLAGIYAADTRNRKAQARMATIASFEVNGRRISKARHVELMTISEIERSLYTARSVIQDALDYERNNDTLKSLGVELVLHVDQLKLQSLDIRRKITVTSLPMHLLCLQLGLPYNQADRILKINSDVTCPNFVSGAVDVYVRP